MGGAGKIAGGLAVAASVAVLSALPAGSIRAAVMDTAVVAVTIDVGPLVSIEFPEGLDFIITVPGHPPCEETSHGHGHGHHKAKYEEGRLEAKKKARGGDCDDRHGHKDKHRHKHDPIIQPVRIPFIVHGNALATVSVKPDAFLRIRGGRYLGKADGPGDSELGYHVIVHFPAPTRHYAWLGKWDDWRDWDDWRRWGGFGHLPHWSRLAHLPGLNGVGTPELTADMVKLKGEAHGVIYLVARRDWTANGHKATPGDYSGSLEVTATADER